MRYVPVRGETPAERRRYVREVTDAAPGAIVFEPAALIEDGERGFLDQLVESWLATSEVGS